MTEMLKGTHNFLARFSRDVSGTTAIEYAVIASGIAVAIVAAVNGVGSQVDTMFQSVEGSF